MVTEDKELQDFKCVDCFGNICAIVTSSSEEHARNVFKSMNWEHLYVADRGTMNYRIIEMR